MYEARVGGMGARGTDFARLRSVRARGRRWGRRARKLALLVLLLAAATFLFARVAMGSGGHATDRLVVRPGDTLWTIAEARYPDADPRIKVEEIERANQLPGPVLQPGQVLRLPAS